MFVVGNNALSSNAPYDALNEAMSSKNQISVSSFSSMKIYGLGYGPCVELFAPNQKLLDRDLSGYSWADKSIVIA